MDERLQRTRDALRELGADWAVLTNPDSIAYALGYAPPVEVGPSPFAAGPAVGLVGADGAAGLLVADVEAGTVRDGVVETYAAYGPSQSAPPYEAYQAALRSLIGHLGVGGRLAVEPESCSAVVLDVLPPARRAGLGAVLRRARAVKTEAELSALRRCAEVAAAGQRTLPGALAAGRRELDVFADLRRAMEMVAGERIAVAGDLLSGRDRTAAVAGWPGARAIETGDAVLADLAPRVGGYWGDSAATTVLGCASPRQLRLFEAARAGLDEAITALRPSLTAAGLHRLVRRCVQQHGFDYPHHTGHSIGTAVHEHPRLCEGEDMPLLPGMVLMVEPGAYHPEIGGVRLEWMLRVTSAGCEPVCSFPHVPATE